DTLKIDKSFIHSATTDHFRAELVRAILSIARCLNQVVVAEGVETREQADFLAAEGCQLAQGYLFSPAVPREQLLAFSVTYLVPEGMGFKQPSE
ncbi:MAG: EAL domain-containing protein, partial [Rhodoferax sp.]